MAHFIIRAFEIGDAGILADSRARNARADGVDPHSSLDAVPSEADVAALAADADSFLVAVSPTGERLGYGWSRSWTEGDLLVILVDGYVEPGHRGRGIATAMLQELEAIARRRHPSSRTGPAVLGGNASSDRPDRAALLVDNGYTIAFVQVEMEADQLTGLARSLPSGAVARRATAEDAAAIVSLTERVWAGRPFFGGLSRERVEAWLGDSDLSLFTVALLDGQIVGLAAASEHDDVGRIDDLQVDPAVRRRGFGAALVGMLVAELPGRGVRSVRLDTEAHDPAGARSLYESIGFRVIRSHGRYRKELGLPDAGHATIATILPGLALRQLTPSDAREYWALVDQNRDHLTRHGDFTDLAASSFDAVESQLRAADGSPDRFGVRLDGRLVGQIDLIRHTSSAIGLGYWLDEAHRGKGLMTIALRTLMEHVARHDSTVTFHAGVTHGNQSSVSLLHRLGFSVRADHETYTSYHRRAGTSG